MIQPERVSPIKRHAGATDRQLAASLAWVLALALVLALTLTSIQAMAAADDPASPDMRDLPFTPPPDQEESRLATEAVLPNPMPALLAFEALQPFGVEGDSPNQFALDSDSVQFQYPFVLISAAVRSPSGVVTTSYQAYNCRTRQMRLMALPGPDGTWQASSSRVRWRDVMSGDGRNRQHQTLFAAACRIGSTPASSVDELLSALRNPRMTPNP